ATVPWGEVYGACGTARELLIGEHAVSRVIARPFVGRPGAYARTPNRRDFSIEPVGTTLLDRLAAAGIPRVGIGKVDDLFAGRHIASEHTPTNADAYRLIEQALARVDTGFIFVNVIEFDQSWGHRNDVAGFHEGLRELDAGVRGERRPGRAGPHGAAARLRALQRVPRRRRARGDGRPGIRGDERGERVVRSHDLRGADGAGRGGRGRGPQVHAHRGGDGGGPAGRALRRLPPAARRVRDGPRGGRRRPDERAALDPGPAAPRRLHPRVPRPMRRAALAAALTALTAATACTEDVTAPGHCPDFCPSGSITGVDTVLQTVVQRDSAFRGFVRPHEARSLLAATLPGVIDGRAIVL